MSSIRLVFDGFFAMAHVGTVAFCKRQLCDSGPGVVSYWSQAPSGYVVCSIYYASRTSQEK